VQVFTCTVSSLFEGKFITFFKIIFFIFLNTTLVYSSVLEYKNRAKELHLANQRYWQILLHMDNNVSEIDDKNFFFAKDGNRNPQHELEATLEAFFSNENKDDNSSICKYPARYTWLKDELNAVNFPEANCVEYDKILKRVDPKSTTLVFPSAHINSPASMFGHTFLRINSSYDSKLLSYAINYAADADPDKENGVIFAIKGLVGGYFGLYSLLPYYEKLKEYRDSEQRDIWEYDLNLTQVETMRMFRHIWELNGTHSYYYFFTQNCSYNMLWLLESARPTLTLRKHFHFQVIPLETVHIANLEGLIKSLHYRPSKRTILLKYEELIEKRYIHLPIELAESKINVTTIVENNDIEMNQKRYILESATEYLEYQFSRGKIKKERYLELFHQFTTQRAQLGIMESIHIKTPANPLQSHRAFRVQTGLGKKEGEIISYLGIRPAYHDLEDSNYGFLRGTQIEFLNLLLSNSKGETKVEDATIISIVSLAQRSSFFHSFSWRTHIGWNNDYLNDKPTFNFDVGAGYSWGNKFAFVYLLVDPLFYMENSFVSGVGGSIGINIDKYKYINTNIDLTKRYYDNGINQTLIKVEQGITTSQNTQIVLKYDYKDKYIVHKKQKEETYRVMFKYYF